MQKHFAGSIILMLCAIGWGSSGFGQEVPAPRGELRIVDKSPFNWISVTLNVFEHLMELDKDGKLVPRLATSWQWLNDRTLEVKLREGVKFHNGEVLDEEVLRTVDPETQQRLIRQMERHTHDQAYFLFLCNPVQLYAVNKAVEFVPYVTFLNLAETGVTEQHWSVRQDRINK